MLHTLVIWEEVNGSVRHSSWNFITLNNKGFYNWLKNIKCWTCTRKILSSGGRRLIKNGLDSNFRNLLWQRTYILIIITGTRQRKQVKIILFLTCGRVIRSIFGKYNIS
jgi:hypothetical protein